MQFTYRNSYAEAGDQRKGRKRGQEPHNRGTWKGCFLSSWNSVHLKPREAKSRNGSYYFLINFEKSPRKHSSPHEWMWMAMCPWLSGYLYMISYFPRFFSCRGCFTSSMTLTIPKSRPPSAPAKARGQSGERGEWAWQQETSHGKSGDSFIEFGF